MATPPDDPYRKFVAELRAVRMKRKLSQGDLAKLVNLSRAQMTAIASRLSDVEMKAVSDYIAGMR